MAIASADELLEGLTQFHVLELAHIEALSRELHRIPVEPVELSRLLVQRGWVTAYQLGLVCAGRGQELVLGQYVIRDQLGEGGMGQVFVARHRRLDRLDALKVIRPEHVASPVALRRFLQEARAAARLSHPNIVSIYDADEWDGIHFLAMEYIPGLDLSRLLQKVGPLPAALACHFLRQAALGLQHAHERRLVHRDLKPANLLLAAETHSIKILDMGLARLHRRSESGVSLSEVTEAGSVMGTPDYMAPEQALDAHDVDIRADIYSLGCTLYALLAGAPPFATASVVQKILWHQDREPPPLEGLCANLPVGLPELCRRALAKKPEARFQSPAELVAALAPFCSPEPPLPAAVQAALHRPPPDLDIIDFSFAQPGGDVPTALQTADTSPTEDVPPVSVPPPILPPPTIVQPPQGPSATEAIDVLPADLPEALPAALPARRPPPRARKDSARPDTVKLPGTQTGPRGGRKRRPRSRGKQSLLQGQTLLALLGGLVLIGVLAGAGWIFTPWRAGLGLAAAGGEIRRIDGHTDIIYGVAFSPDGKRAASCGKDRTVRVWDLETGTLEARLEGFAGSVNSVAWSPNDDLLLVGGQSSNGQDNRSVRFWDVNPGKQVRQFHLEGHTTSVLCGAFSPDGKLALTAGGLRRHGDLALRLWDVEQRTQVGQLEGHEDYVFRVVFSTDGKWAASCSNDGSVRVWDIPGRKEAHCFRSKSRRILCLAFAPDGKQLAGGGEDSSLHFWDLNTHQETTLPGHSRPIFGVAFLPDGKRLLSAGADMTLRLWDLTQGQQLQRFEGHTDIITNLALSPDGTRVLTCSQDRTVRLWQLP